MSSRKLQLSDVCEISMGQAPAGETYNTVGKGHPLIAGAGDFGEVTPKATKFTTAPTKVSRAGDIILCIRATIGDRNWADGEYCLGRGVAGLAARSEKLHQRFLWHWLGYAEPALRAKGRGATFLQVSKADIGSMEIPVPPLQDQRRIAAILDKADELRAKRREAIAKLDQLLQSVFLDMFGDLVTNSKGIPETSLGDLTSIRTGKLDANASSSDGAYPFFTCAREPLRISSYSYDCECALVAGNGDLNVKQYSGKFDAYQRTYIVESTDKSRLTTNYLYHFLDAYVGELRKQSIGGIIKYIKMGNLTEARLPLPPLALQSEFNRRCSVLNSRRAEMVASDAMFSRLFQTLQHCAFTGTL